MAVSRVQTEAQMEIHHMRHQLESSQAEINDYKIKVRKQSGVLGELESTIVEFEALKEEEETVNNHFHAITGETDRVHLQELEERDRKISALKKQLEERRAEFRKSLDALQADMLESNALYSREIHVLQATTRDAADIAERCQKLEQIVREMKASEKNCEPNIVPEKESDSRIVGFAELENSISEKDKELNSMREQLEQTQQRLKDLSEASLEQHEESVHAVNAMKELRQQLIEEREKQDQSEDLLETTAINEKLRQQLKYEKEERSKLENEIKRLESVVKANSGKPQALSDLERTANTNSQLTSQLKSELDQRNRLEIENNRLKSELEQMGLLEIENANLRLELGRHSQVEAENIHLKSELELRSLVEIENAHLESMIQSNMGRERSLEREIEKLKAAFQQDLANKRTHTKNMSNPIAELSPTARENLFSTTSKLETPATPPRIDTLLDELPIHSPKPVSAITGISNINGTAMSPGLISPAAFNIVTAITAAANQHHGTNFKTPISSPSDTLRFKGYDTIKGIGEDGKEKWCKLCEREGHESVECPYEEEF